MDHLNVTWKGGRKSNALRVSGDLKRSVTWEHTNRHRLATQLSQNDMWLNCVDVPSISQGMHTYILYTWSNYFGCAAMKDADLRWDSWEYSLPTSGPPPASLHFLHRHYERSMRRASSHRHPSRKGWRGGFCLEIWEKIKDRQRGHRVLCYSRAQEKKSCINVPICLMCLSLLKLLHYSSSLFNSRCNILQKSYEDRLFIK